MRLLLQTLFALALAGQAVAADSKAARYYEDALKRYEGKDMPGAIIQLKNVLQADNKMLAAHLLLGKALMRNGELKAAEAALEDALNLGVSRSEVVPSLGQVYLMLGEPEKLLEQISASGLPVATRLEILTLRGTAYAEIGRPLQAAQSFAEARALDPLSALPLIAEIPLMLRKGDLEQAKSLAARALDLAPKNAQAWSAQGSVLHAMMDRSGALAAYDRSLALEADFAEARTARAGLLIDLNRWNDAEKDLDFLKDSLLDEPRAAYLRALVADHKGDAVGAKDALNDAVKIVDGLPRTWISHREHLLMVGALAHYALQNWEKAREYLETLVSTSGRNYLARVLLASTYVETKDYDRAQPLLENLQRTNPNDAQVQFMLGTVYLAQRRFSQASVLLEKAAAQSANPASTRELGLSQLALGREALGIANLEKAFAANPRDVKTGIELAMIHARRGQNQKAVQVAEGIVKNDPKNLATLNFLGTIKNWTGDKAGARTAFAKALSIDPTFAPAALNLSRLDIAESRIDDARNRLSQLLAKRSSDPNILFELGLLEQKAKQPEEAIRYLQKADDVQSGDLRPGLVMVEVLTGQGRYEQALSAAKQLASKYSDRLEAQLALGKAYLVTGDTNGARNIFTNATRLASYDPALQLQIGRFQLNAGNVEGAYYNVQKAMQEKPDDEGALAMLVEIETLRGQPAKADAAMRALATKYPSGIALLLTRANLAMARGQYAAALDGYRTLLAREATTATAINIVQAHVALGELPKAISFLDGWIKKRPDDLIALKTMAEVQSRAGQAEGARKTYATILAKEPDDPLTLNNYAIVLQKLNDPTAQAPAEKALKLLPGNPNITDTLGWILVQQGKIDTGLRHLREARLRSPENRAIRFHLAYALAKAGRKTEAKEELAAALAGQKSVQGTDEVARLKAELGL